MAAFTWPGTLPQKMQSDGYSESKSDGRLKSEMDAGPPFFRPRFTTTITSFSGNMIMTTAQVATLETFYDTTLTVGVSLFDFPHPRTGATIEVRFSGPYTVGNIGGEEYQVNMQLERKVQ